MPHTDLIVRITAIITLLALTGCYQIGCSLLTDQGFYNCWGE